MPSSADDRLLQPYRAVRPVTAGVDAPWPGLLVRLPSGESALLVDSAELPGDWPGWAAEASGHLVAPMDVVRRPGGHHVLLPAFTGRLRDLAERRRVDGVPLSTGESVTLAVSLLRGLAQLGEEAFRAQGEWWLTDAGRPMLAAGLGDRRACEAARVVMADLDGRVGDAMERILEDAAARGAVVDRELARSEAALFALAPALPLAQAPPRTRSRPRLEPMSAAAPRHPAAAREDPEPHEGHRGHWYDSLARHVDADLADLVSRTTTGAWRRLRAPHPGSRTRPWLLAGGAAAVVLVAGMLWPAGGPATADGVAHDERGETVATGTPAPTASSDPGEPTDGDALTDASGENAALDSRSPASPAPIVVEDLAAVVDGLLSARTGCAGDPGCLAEVLVDPEARFAAGAIDLPAADRSTILLDEFGGVAVFRVEAADSKGDGQLVVVQRDGDRWLLRDVHAAQQP